jgi:hypothetical protein
MRSLNESSTGSQYLKAPSEGAFLLGSAVHLLSEEDARTSGCGQTALSFVWNALLLISSWVWSYSYSLDLLISRALRGVILVVSTRCGV